MVKAQRKKSQIIVREAIQGRLMQAIESPRQLQEVMVDFWYNHFNIYAQKGLTIYGLVIMNARLFVLLC